MQSVTQMEETSSKYCVFCYKAHNLGSGEVDTNLKRFLVLVQRYLKIPLKLNEILTGFCDTESNEDIQQRMEHPCELCLEIVASFNELYHEMKCVELRLLQKVSSLINIMKDASKVGYRKRPLKKIYGEGRFVEFSRGRRRWIQHCSQSLLKVFPVVRTQNMCPVKQDPEVSMHQPDLPEFSNRWLISLAVVSFILMISSTSSVSSADDCVLEDLEIDDADKMSLYRSPVKKYEPEDVFEDVFASSHLGNDDRSISTSDNEETPVDLENVSENVGTSWNKHEVHETVSVGQCSDMELDDDEVCGGLDNDISSHFNSEHENPQNTISCKMEADTGNQHMGFPVPSFNNKNPRPQLEVTNTQNSLEVCSQLSDNVMSLNVDSFEPSTNTVPTPKKPYHLRSLLKTPRTTERKTEPEFLDRVDCDNTLSGHGNEDLQEDAELGENTCMKPAHVDGSQEAINTRVLEDNANGEAIQSASPNLNVFQTIKDIIVQKRSRVTGSATANNSEERLSLKPDNAIGSSSPNQARSRAVYNLRKRSAPPPTSKVDSDTESESSKSDEEYAESDCSDSSSSSCSWSCEREIEEISSKIVTRRPPPANPSRSRSMQTMKEFFCLTPAQVSELEHEFKTNKILEKVRRIELAIRLKLSSKVIRKWWKMKQQQMKPPRVAKATKDSIVANEESIVKSNSNYLYCNLDDCNYKTKRKENHESHQKLHQLGTYPCQFCDISLPSPMLLSLHESDKHSKESSGESNFLCSRCPFQTSFQTVYVTHFAVEHLNISGLPTLTAQTCSICQLEVQFPKSHFRLVHNTTGVDHDRIINCKEANCDAVFINKPVYQRHKREHHKISIEDEVLVEKEVKTHWKCNDCPKTFYTLNGFRKHRKKMHNKLLICAIGSCEERCLNQQELEMHYKLHRKFKCTKCSFQTDFIPEQLEHDLVCLELKTAHGYKCPDCEFVCKSVPLFVEHRLEVHMGLTGRFFKCSVCSETFANDNRRQNHYFRLHGAGVKESFKCSECPAFFTKRIQMVCHRRLKHKKIVQWTCKHCDKKLSSKWVLIDHVTKVHRKPFDESQPNPVVCDHPKCGRAFDNEDDLIYHKMYWCELRRNLKKATCPICAKSFLGGAVLKRHLLKHRPKINRQWKCDSCNKSFSELRYLRLHQVSHADKNHGCSECSKRFVTKPELARHFRETHKITRIECRDCKQVLTTPGTYRSHRKEAHDFFECPVKFCTKRFPTQEDANQHAKLHGKFSCDECVFRTGLAWNLMEHEIECRKLKVSTRFKCPECEFIAQIPAVLIDHRLETHLGITRKIFKCQVCGDSFGTSAGRSYHFKEQHHHEANKSDQCDRCPAYFGRKVYLERHLEVCQGPNGRKKARNYCDMCNEKFGSDMGYSRHSKLHGTWKCHFCPTEEHFATDLAIHEIENHGSGDDVHCPRCDWQTPDKRQVTAELLKIEHFVSEHLKLTTKCHICPICHQEYFTKLTVQAHLRKFHKGDGNETNSFKCDQCPASFPKKIQMLTHKKATHEQKSSQVVCADCGRSYKSEAGLVIHIQRMHSENTVCQFKCNQVNCGRVFPTELDLVSHQTYVCGKTSKEKVKEKVICPQCGKIFKGVGGLKTHMHTHDPNRPTEWKCDICSKTFNSKQGFQFHQEYHKGPEEWKYMCAVCSKKCASKQKLDDHMRTHTKEKPFVCQVCGEKYAHRHNLQNHIKSKHKEVKLETKKHVQRFCVSRKGKKLGNNFCFTKAKDMGEHNSDSSDCSD